MSGILLLILVIVGICVFPFIKDSMQETNRVVKEGGITNEGNRRIAIACAAAVTVFLVAGIPGDSMIVHSPTFWTFLGIGMAAGWTELRRKKQS